MFSQKSLPAAYRFSQLKQEIYLICLNPVFYTPVNFPSFFIPVFGNHCIMNFLFSFLFTGILLYQAGYIVYYFFGHSCIMQCAGNLLANLLRFLCAGIYVNNFLCGLFSGNFFPSGDFCLFLIPPELDDMVKSCIFTDDNKFVFFSSCIVPVYMILVRMFLICMFLICIFLICIFLSCTFRSQQISKIRAEMYICRLFSCRYFMCDQFCFSVVVNDIKVYFSAVIRIKKVDKICLA